MPAASRALLELARERRPDLVVISGDLTQRAKPREFRQAREFAARLERPWIAVPGNHDVPMYRFWERLLIPYGAYRAHFHAELEPVWQDDALFVVGVNSAHGLTIDEGRVRRSRLRRLARQLDGAPPGATRVVVIHHLLIPPPLPGKQQVLRNAGATVEVLAEAGVDLVLSGHHHRSFFGYGQDLYPVGGRPLPLVYAGTGSSSRGRGVEAGVCACNWVEIHGAEIRLSVLRWRPGAEAFAESERYVLPADRWVDR